jgi:hypothetical protein
MKDLLLEVLDHGFDKTSWHGANLTGALRGLTPAAAAKRIPGRKSIWEQLLHAAYWKKRVINRIAGTQRFPRRGSNWPAAPAKATEAAWRADLALLHEMHGKLRAAVAVLPDRALTPKTVKMIHGVAFHDVYHAGQIKLLRRLIGVNRGA